MANNIGKKRDWWYKGLNQGTEISFIDAVQLAHELNVDLDTLAKIVDPSYGKKQIENALEITHSFYQSLENIFEELAKFKEHKHEIESFYNKTSTLNSYAKQILYFFDDPAVSDLKMKLDKFLNNSNTIIHHSDNINFDKETVGNSTEKFIDKFGSYNTFSGAFFSTSGSEEACSEMLEKKTTERQEHILKDQTYHSIEHKDSTHKENHKKK